MMNLLSCTYSLTPPHTDSYPEELGTAQAIVASEDHFVALELPPLTRIDDEGGRNERKERHIPIL